MSLSLGQAEGWPCLVDPCAAAGLGFTAGRITVGVAQDKTPPGLIIKARLVGA